MKILFRPCLDTEHEMKTAKDYFTCLESRNDPLLEGDVVIGRYSVLPYYEELEKDLKHRGCRLINSYAQHLWVANAANWAEVLGPELTPPVYPGENYYRLPEGSYVVKGKTNSRKHKWETHMFAPTKADIGKVVSRLLDDPFISEQGLIIRPYVPLRKFGEALNGLPITNEWRTFWYKGRLVACGWYWANHPDFKPADPTYMGDIIDFAQKAADKVKNYIDFYVIDVAQRQDGSWMVIELNDGQMSGLVDITHDEFYYSLYKEVQFPPLLRTLYMMDVTTNENNAFSLTDADELDSCTKLWTPDTKINFSIVNTDFGIDVFFEILYKGQMTYVIDTYDKSEIFEGRLQEFRWPDPKTDASKKLTLTRQQSLVELIDVCFYVLNTLIRQDSLPVWAR